MSKKLEFVIEDNFIRCPFCNIDYCGPTECYADDSEDSRYLQIETRYVCENGHAWLVMQRRYKGLTEMALSQCLNKQQLKMI